MITHAHGDHARWGVGSYLCSREGARVLRTRLGPDGGDRSRSTTARPSTSTASASRSHPAGHILGSAQVRVDIAARCGSSPGDYKTDPDPTCTPFEPVRCHTFVTRVHVRAADLPLAAQIGDLRRDQRVVARPTRDAGTASVVFAYALGKAQRLLAGLDADIGPIYTHGAVERLNRDYRDGGIALPPTTHAAIAAERSRLRGEPHRRAAVGAGSTWLRRFGDVVDRIRVRLDARPRRTATSRARSRLRALRPRRLAGAARRDRRDGRRARVGDARLSRAVVQLAAESVESMRTRWRAIGRARTTPSRGGSGRGRVALA